LTIEGDACKILSQVDRVGLVASAVGAGVYCSTYVDAGRALLCKWAPYTGPGSSISGKTTAIFAGWDVNDNGQIRGATGEGETVVMLESPGATYSLQIPAGLNGKRLILYPANIQDSAQPPDTWQIGCVLDAA
jgi:hypothetical protein